MAGVRPSQPPQEIFSIKRRFQQSTSQPSKFKEACSGGHQRGYPLKSGYFTALGSSSIKTAAHRHRHVAYHN